MITFTERTYIGNFSRVQFGEIGQKYTMKPETEQRFIDKGVARRVE